MREFHKFEEAKESELTSAASDVQTSHRALLLVIQNVVDQLICEEKDRPEHLPASLHDVEISEEMNKNLDDIRTDFLSGKL